MVLISVFDKKASVYEAPISFPHVAHALRTYAEVPKRKPEHQFSQYPSDYDLYLVGEFDEVSGLIHPVNPPGFLEHLSNVFAERSNNGQGA